MDFDKCYSIENSNEYTTTHIQNMSFQHKYVSTLPFKTAQKTGDRLLRCIPLNWLFLTFAESRSVFVFSKSLLFVRKFF